MSKTINPTHLDVHIDEEGLEGTKASVRFNPESITPDLVEFYAEQADLDNYDVDAAVRAWRGIIESGYGLALYNGEVLAMEFVPISETNPTQIVRVADQPQWTAFNMGLDYGSGFEMPTSITKLYVLYLAKRRPTITPEDITDEFIEFYLNCAGLYNSDYDAEELTERLRKAVATGGTVPLTEEVFHHMRNGEVEKVASNPRYNVTHDEDSGLTKVEGDWITADQFYTYYLACKAGLQQHAS